MRNSQKESGKKQKLGNKRLCVEEGNGALAQVCISQGLSRRQKYQAISEDHHASAKIQEVPRPDLCTQAEDSLAAVVFAASYSGSGMLWSTRAWGIGEEEEQAGVAHGRSVRGFWSTLWSTRRRSAVGRLHVLARCCDPVAGTVPIHLLHWHHTFLQRGLLDRFRSRSCSKRGNLKLWFRHLGLINVGSSDRNFLE